MDPHGMYCFRYKGLYYVIYNGQDSYPEGLGTTLVNQLRRLEPQDLRNLIDNIMVVNLDGYNNYLENMDFKEKQFPKLSSDIVEKFRKITLQDSVYLVSIRQLYKEFRKETMDDASMFNEWLNHNFDSQENKWGFIFDQLFSNQKTLQLNRALSFGYLPVDCAPTRKPPENDLWIEWIYVIDLDNEKFSVQNYVTTLEFDYHNIPQNWIMEFKEKEENSEDVNCTIYTYSINL